MYLRSVEVHGFKSFADRQRFEFGPGMTAVVGPNGSGKSNVSEAIRWALGEQSARSLRARKTEDVIFSGSDKRRQLGMAEVTLVLDNAEQWMPVDFTEVTVTRRAYRSGESEYLINGQKVRLMDVQDLFRRAQVGQNSYAMMSQGLVDEVLALRPVERRDLIEEAADVHRHRIELNRAERRLTETRDNLGHVRLLIREVEPRLRQLERQSVRAERFRTLQAQLSDVLQVYYEHELRAAQEALTAARARHDQQAQAFHAAQSNLEATAARTATVDLRAMELRSTLERAQAAERTLTEEGLRLQQAVALAEQRLELLAMRRQEVETELAAAAPFPDEDETDPEAEAAARQALVADSQTALEREREALRSADEAARTLLRTLAEAEARRTRFEAELRDTERRLAEHEARDRRRSAERMAARERRESAKVELRDYGRRVLALDRERTQLTFAAQDARRRRDVAERQLEEQLRVAVEANDALRQAAARVQQLRERLGMLASLSEQAFDADGAARALLAAANELKPDGTPAVTGVLGIVSRLLRVPDGLDRAIEAALSEQLSAVVVETERDAIAAIAYLRESQAGAVTLYPLDRMPHVYPLNLFNERGVIGIAARLVRVEQRFRPLADTLLGRVIVVDSIEVATRMVRRGLGSVVTRDGILLRQAGSMYGGRTGAGAETFGVIRELETIPAEIEGAQLAEERARGRLVRAQGAVEDARDAVAAARKLVDEAEERRRLQEEARTKLRRDLGAVGGHMRLAHAALRDDEGGDAAAEARERAAALSAALAALEDEIAGLRDRSEAVGEEREAAAERAALAATALATATGDREVWQARHAQRAAERRQARERLEQRQALIAAVRRESEDIELSLRDLRAQTANNRTALSAAEAAVGPAHAALADALGEQRELGATRGDAQNRLFTAEREMLASEAALRQSALQVQTLLQQIADEGLEAATDGAVRPAPPPPEGPVEGGAPAVTASLESAVGAPAAGGADIDPEELRKRITELRADIRALGPVNIDALEDLSEERERHEFLTHQVYDLEAAEAELRLAIRDLERLIRTRFDETFVTVNERFQSYFERFFGGGAAELRIAESEAEGGEAGVEISAQPPGKRISSLNTLSGGERSMTSVALLFALLAVNPAPVCVMDEVDAALDEANVGRFVDTLRELAGRSQFIIITHNRRTTEAADTIYGISMGDESTSQVLSLRLADLPRAS